MAKVTFLLYNPAADKPTPIIASVTFDGQRHKVYVGISILPKQWDKKEQKALTRGYSHTNNGTVNDTLEQITERLETMVSWRREGVRAGWLGLPWPGRPRWKGRGDGPRGRPGRLGRGRLGRLS